MLKVKFQASLCSRGDWFEPRFFKNPEDMFCRAKTHLLLYIGFLVARTPSHNKNAKLSSKCVINYHLQMYSGGFSHADELRFSNYDLTIVLTAAKNAGLVKVHALWHFIGGLRCLPTYQFRVSSMQPVKVS